MTEQEHPKDIEGLRKLTISQLVSLQKNYVEAIGNLDLREAEGGQHRKQLEELDILISNLTALNFSSRTIEFEDILKIKDATARMKESAEQLEQAAKNAGSVEALFKIVDQALKLGAMLVGI